MATRKLTEYERKRSFEKTPEPRGGKKPKRPKKTKGNRFVVHEHHARRLHWDLRLERDGVLASWALPKGVPQDPKENRLAVRTEDHPLEYLDFEAEIPKGEYGAGRIEIWDRGTYEAEKVRDDELILTFAGERVKGRYALFQTKDDNWMIHRMDPPLDPEREPMPKQLKPMLATLSTEPAARRGRLGVRDQVGRRSRDRLLRGRPPAAREPHPPRDHLALPGAARPRPRARRPPTPSSTARWSPSTTTASPASSCSRAA